MPVRKRRIAVVTGSRADYGILHSTLRAIDEHPGLELQLFVAGMHLLPKFGHTARDIERDGWQIARRIPMQRGDDSATDQARGLSRGISGMAECFATSKPDVVLVLGDRIEAMAGALAAVATGRILAHIHGGDVAEGDFDDSLRHAITKLAHIHFPATRSAAARIIRMGESPRCVFCVGAPGLDRLAQLIRERAANGPLRGNPRGRILERESRYALVIQHAHGRSPEIEERAARIVLDAAAAAGIRRTIVYPNTDRGHRGVLRAIERHVADSNNGDATVVRSLPREEFLRAMLESALVLGNSSCGIIEAPFAGVPSVNVGDRQRGRERGGRAVLHAAENAVDVERAIHRALRARAGRGRTGPYGDGGAGGRIASLLAGAETRGVDPHKRITY
jgi:UDP-N-acetylglucosamine 2-epimerase (non-hydrolysing)/GDP/UDP-N,N'-diacetylbacillosamine 2-epimerase (hydrolysing)